jgi:hypothetical protein
LQIFDETNFEIGTTDWYRSPAEKQKNEQNVRESPNRDKGGDEKGF